MHLAKHEKVPAGQKQRQFDNIAAAMQGLPNEIKRMQIALIARCDHNYGADAAMAVTLDPPGDDHRKGSSATNEPKVTMNN